MSPEYLRELADLADPNELWRRSWIGRQRFTPEQKKQCDMGVALRRHASHIAQLEMLIDRKLSLLITPFSQNSSAQRSIETPPDHQKLRDR